MKPTNHSHHNHRPPPIIQPHLQHQLLLLLLLLPSGESTLGVNRRWKDREDNILTNGEGKEPPEGEVEDMIASTLSRHLPGCHKVVVSGRYPLGSMMQALGEEVFVWEMDSLLASLPPPRPLLRSTHPQGNGAPLCIVFVLLAPLQVVGAAIRVLQRGEWFQGARKLVFAYTGNANTSLVAAVERHPTLRSSYDTVLAAWTRPQENEVSVQPRVYHLVTTCPYCRNGGPNVALADQWRPGMDQTTEKSLYPDTFKNFHGHQFKIVTLEYAPFSCYRKVETAENDDGDDDIYGDGGIRRGPKLELKDCVDTRMVNAMATSLNFTYVVHEPFDGQWGYRLQNGSYTGVIGSVQRLEADFSLNVAFTGDRERVIDYTLGYYNDPLTFCTSPPRPLPRVLSLVRPFHLEVWTGFVVTLVVVGMIYYVTRKLESSSSFSSSSVPSFLATILKIYGACLTQSQSWAVGDVSRAVVGGWVLFSLVMYRSYVAMLTASLALPPLSPTLNTLQELVDSDLSWGIQDQGAADYQLLKTSTVPLYQQVYKGLQVCPNLDVCIARARDTRYAFITWRLYMEDRIAIRFTSATGEPQLHVATSDFFPSEIGWAMTPGCPFRDKFNHQIRRLLEAGLLTRWLNQLIHDPGRREAQESLEPQQAEGSQQPLTLDHVQGAYYVLVIGCVVSCLFFLLEVVCSSQYPPYQSNLLS